MDQDVFIITSDSETYIGKVSDILNPDKNLSGFRIDCLILTLRDVIDDLVFGDENKNYAVLTVELR